MASPFEKALTAIIHGAEDGGPEALPSWSLLSFVRNHLANQDAKLQAIRCELIDTLFLLYDEYKHLQKTGTISNEAEELKASQLPELIPRASDPTDLTCNSRQETIRILRSLSLLESARNTLINRIGLDRVLQMFADPNPLVRSEVCELLWTICLFPDGQDAIRANQVVASTVYDVMHGDQDVRVVMAAIKVCTSLTFADTEAHHEQVVPRLVDLLKKLTPYVSLRQVPHVGTPSSRIDAIVANAKSASAASKLSNSATGTSASSIASTSSSSASSTESKPTASTPATSSSSSSGGAVAAQPAPAGLAGIPIPGALATLLECIGNIARASQAGIENCIVAGAVEPCILLLRAQPFSVHQQACAALMALSTAEASKRMLAQSDAALSCLAAIGLDSGAPDVLRSNASRCLRNVAENSEGLHKVGGMLVSSAEAVRDIFDDTMTARVVDALLDSPTHRLQILRSLELLLKSKRGALAAWSVPGIVGRLEALASGGAGKYGQPSGPSLASLSQEGLLANKCLSVLCQEVRDARVDLERLKQQQKKDSQRAATEGFMLVPGIKPEGIWPA